MRICGLQTLSMVDYPGKLAATVFTGGCNLRCPFCHNALLVTRLDESPVLTEEDVLSFLSRRRGLLDGVVLSGGEPLTQPGVPAFLKAVRALGFPVKLDTNGCYPDALSDLLRQGLVDYVAMDVKNTPEKYPQTVGIPDFDPAVIARSAALIAQSGVNYELRTTVVQELHTPADIAAIGTWMQGAPRYFLQCFVDSGALISPGLHAPARSVLEAMAQAARPFFGQVLLRGVD